jgi:hypothetical protein
MAATRVMWQTGCVVWKKTALPAHPFKEDLASSQEWTFHLMQVISGIRYQILTQTTFLIREHQNRIGKQYSAAKIFSTFRSRQYIYQILRDQKRLSIASERYLLHGMLSALRASLHTHYFDNSALILRFLVKHFFSTHHKAKLLTVFVFAVPLYALTKRGAKLFRMNRHRTVMIEVKEI